MNSQVTSSNHPIHVRVLAWSVRRILGQKVIDRLVMLDEFKRQMSRQRAIAGMFCNANFGRDTPQWVEIHNKLADQHDRLKFWWMKPAFRMEEKPDIQMML